MTQNVVVELDEQLENTRALFVGSSFPIIAEKLSEILTKQGCKITSTSKKSYKNNVYDYIVYFGPVRKPSRYFKCLSKQAKGVMLVSEKEMPHDTLSLFPMVILSATESYKLSVIVDQLETALFTQKKKNIPEGKDKKKIIKKPGKSPSNIKNNNKRIFPKFIRKILLVVLAVFMILMLPFIVTMGSMAIAVNSLKTIPDKSIDQQTRYEKVEFARTNTKIAETMVSVTDPFMRMVSPETADVLSGSVLLLSSIVDTASTSLELSDIVNQEGRSLLSGDDTNLPDRLSDISYLLDRMGLSLNQAESGIQKMQPISTIPGVETYWEKTEQIHTLNQTIQSFRSGLNALPSLLALDGKKMYLLLFQNNFELRPTGGFIGSYALVSVDHGAITDIKIEDVYEADGQLKGSVEPPEPIASHLNQPNWFLRDSNWNPDFLLSAKQAEWFLKKEIGQTVDGVIAIDLYALENILKATGEIYVPDYNATVTADDFFLKLQHDTHDDFFPGSNEKKDLISSLASALLIKLTDAKDISYFDLIGSIYKSLEQKHILIFSNDEIAQNTINSLGWGGRVLSAEDKALEQTVLDYTMVVDANLGVNKVNAHIKREFFHTISAHDTNMNHDITVFYKNESADTEKDSLFHGTYKNYVRFIVPSEASLHQITSNGVQVKEEDLSIQTIEDKMSIGWLITLPPGQEVKATVSYTLKLPDYSYVPYQLMLQKQPGTHADTLIIRTESSDDWTVINRSFDSSPHMIPFIKDTLVAVDFVR